MLTELYKNARGNPSVKARVTNLCLFPRTIELGKETGVRFADARGIVDFNRFFRPRRTDGDGHRDAVVAEGCKTPAAKRHAPSPDDKRILLAVALDPKATQHVRHRRRSVRRIQYTFHDEKTRSLRRRCPTEQKFSLDPETSYYLSLPNVLL